jgi:hypothetical protein
VSPKVAKASTLRVVVARVIAGVVTLNFNDSLNLLLERLLGPNGSSFAILGTFSLFWCSFYKFRELKMVLKSLGNCCTNAAIFITVSITKQKFYKHFFTFSLSN